MTQEQTALQLAEKLPSLRQPCELKGQTHLHLSNQPIPESGYLCMICAGRGWAPAVTLGGLMAALAKQGWEKVGFDHFKDEEGTDYWVCSLDNNLRSVNNVAGNTPLEAAMKAALEALA